MNDLIQMTSEELTERDYHEDVIESVKGSIGQLAKIGDASLKALREKRLYRATHKTFEDYCQERLGISRQHASLRIAFMGLLGDLSTHVDKQLPDTEGQARPLKSLPTTELKAQAWTQAQQTTGKDQPSAREVSEAVKDLEAKLASALQRAEIAEERHEATRQQDNAKLRTIRVKEQLLETAQTEAASLRRTIALEAEKLAEAKILEVRAELNAEKAKAAKLAASVKSLKNEREEAIQRGVSNKLREQQQEIDAKEGQLVAIEKRIAFLRQELDPMDEEHEAIARHAPRIAKVDHLINSIAVELSDAFDPDYSQDLPESLMRKWEAGSKKIGQLQDMLNLYLHGDPIND